MSVSQDNIAGFMLGISVGGAIGFMIILSDEMPKRVPTPGPPVAHSEAD